MNAPERTTGKTKSNAIEIPAISLPKGGGAIKGIDEKFSVNTANGTASFSIPLPFSTARGLSPTFSLSYDSGAGNGIFGLGWNFSLSSVKRQTGKELPQYLDGIDSDIFLFSEAEDLVPEFRKQADGSFQLNDEGDYIIHEKVSPDLLFTIRFYKPRIEGLFARIERWSKKDTGEIRWRVITKENITTLFGWTANSRVANPSNENNIFEWLPEFAFDDKGNCVHYIYKKEDIAGFDSSLLHHASRVKDGQLVYTNTYLEKVYYGNKTPWRNFGDAFPPGGDYMFSTVFDYGEYDSNAPFDKINEWDFRRDAFSDYKAGFEIRTTRLCKRVLLFHHFTGANEYEGLVRSLNLEYDTNAEEDFTFLKAMHTHGYIRKADGSYSQKQFPPVTFEYQAHDWNKEVKVISSEALVHAPAGLDKLRYQFTDLYNEGLSGILTEQANGWYYKHNLGEGKFEQAKLVTPKPSFTGLGSNMQLTDLDGDGGKQLVSFDNMPTGFFEINDDNEWQRFRPFDSLPNIDFNDSNLRLLDLNGDGKQELVITEGNMLTWYASAGRNGFTPARRTIQPFDEEEGPHMVFTDAEKTIFLADMSGDGMTDIVRIRNGEVCYWPNLGYGKFGPKITLDNSPVFDYAFSFNPAYIRLADIDGSGTTDIIYLGKNKFTCWKNLSGNRFSATPFEIDSFPEIHQNADIIVTDLLGNGVACIVWTDNLSKSSNSPLKYVDLMNSKKPHLMVSYKNNLGKEVNFEYSASTKFYLEDKLNGREWVTKLHFPVHCISKTETRDIVSGYRFTTSYKYHHGYYDHTEKEFRGFGMVEQIDSEHFEHWVKSDASNIVDAELHQEPVVSKNWFHTGASVSRNKILNQFAQEYWYEEMNRQGFAVAHNEYSLPDARIIAAPGIPSTAIEHLDATGWQQALRSCKGMSLRTEIFAQDAPISGASDEELKKQLTPYAVTSQNCLIELVQPRGKNKFAVFVVKQSEAITYSYDRNTDDPRIAHSLNIKLDEYGNILESVNVVYPRTQTDTALPAETQQEQNKTTIIYSQNQFTNDITGEDMYRLRLPSETNTFELKAVAKSGSYYSPGDFENIISLANEVNYHETDATPAPGNAQKRLLEQVRTNYYRNDLGGPLPLHQLESLAISFESYQLAYTPELLEDIYGTKVNTTLLEEGRFTNSEGDNNWWIRSGTIQYIEGAETADVAQNRFYVPIAYADPYGTKTKVTYYGNYFLFVSETEDAFGNKSKVDLINFRTLSPQRMRDINNNLSESVADELGLVKAIAIMGKGNEADELAGITDFTDGNESALIENFLQAPDSVTLVNLGRDLLQHATARFVYDFDVYIKTGKPATVATITREEHFQKNNNAPLQIGFEYSNGLGTIVMKKAQAEPGIAKTVTVNADNTITVSETDTAASNPKMLRWIGNGRTILNNKGSAVKQYEPYFSVTHHYEDFRELVETGVTPVMYYDAIGRLVKTENPDGSFSKLVFNTWTQEAYDANDTILESAWYTNRVNHLIDAALLAEGKDPAREKAAAEKAAGHANTPGRIFFDSLGRTVLTRAHNKNILTASDEFYHTRQNLDTEGNLRAMVDARGNTLIQYKYDMLGNRVYQNSMDTGQRWLLINVKGNPLRTWDERDHEFQYFYDTLHRPTHSKVSGGDGESPLDHIFDRTVYGESLLLPDRSNEASLQSINVLGKTIKSFDTGGATETPEYDFKGLPVFTTRKLFSKYKEVANWTDANLVSDLDNDAFTFRRETDALGRLIRQTNPDGSIFIPSYNEAGLLTSEAVTHVDPVVTSVYIKDIDYNEKGKRTKIIYGNDVASAFYYDKLTFRLNRIETRRQNNDPLQDWSYTFDPVGNITHVEDRNIPVVFFDNQKTTGIAEYGYDALYRLVSATGRENDAALTFDNQDNWNDASFMHSLNSGSPMQARNYTQQYQYDEAGNITQMRHIAAGNSWTRNYNYETDTNRLVSTQVGSEIFQYPHHASNGFIMAMPHLEDMRWNFREQLVKTIRQNRTDGGTAETTWYQYDARGQRTRKITENQAAPGTTTTKKEERIYFSGYELYKKHSGAGAGLERISMSLMDGSERFVMIETRNDIDDGTEKQLTRYQLHNHLGSAAMELDENAQVISYEEYHPYGTTAYQANNANIRSAAKRYRYSGMERDEETGFEYHGARYYLSWLGRWCSADPAGISGGPNLYGYSRNNPMLYIDNNGLSPKSAYETKIEGLKSQQQRLGHEAKDLENKLLRNQTTLRNMENTLRENPVLKKEKDVMKGIKDAKDNIRELEKQIKGKMDQIDKIGKEVSSLMTEAINAGVSEKKIYQAAGLEVPLSPKSELDAFGRKLKMKGDLPEDVAKELDDLEKKPDAPDIDEKKLAQEAEDEVDDLLGKHGDEAAEGLVKAGKEGGEGALKRFGKWVGRKLGSAAPGGGAALSIVLAPEDQSDEEVVAHAIASEIGVGPVDLDLLWDISGAMWEGTQIRAKREFEETIRLEKEGVPIWAISMRVNRGSKL